MTCEIFKRALLDRFFPRKMRDTKLEKFINIRQGGMSVLDYSLTFTKISMYAQSLVSNPRDEMRHFLTGVSYDLEECCLAMLHDNMNICHLMIHAQQVE